MNSDTVSREISQVEVGVYECEIHIKFRLVEEKWVLSDRNDELLDLLMEAYMAGSDDYMEPLEAVINTQEISEIEASPQMRRQLMRLRNSSELR